MKYTGIILAGGKSTRMGFNKALAQLHGKPMIAHVLETLSATCEEVLISGNQEGFLAFNARIIEDNYPDQGPLGGLQACLSEAKNERCIILSCDTPFVNQDILRQMTDAYQDSDALIASCNGRIHPLIGIYNRSALRTIEANLSAGNLKMTSSLDSMNTQYLEFPITQLHAFTNINTPEELQQWNEALSHKHTVTITYYGMLEEALGIRQETLSLPRISLNLREILLQQHPSLRDFTFSIAIDMEYRETLSAEETPDKIDIMPPFAGG